MNEIQQIKVIVGLGNVGQKYIGTRHNVGFEIIDRIASEYKATDKIETDLYIRQTVRIDGIVTRGSEDPQVTDLDEGRADEGVCRAQDGTEDRADGDVCRAQELHVDNLEGNGRTTKGFCPTKDDPANQNPTINGGVPKMRIKTIEKDILLIQPTTYMNRSGWAVADILDRMGLEPGQILVLSDDFNLDLGRIRIRKKGSDGGQNGLLSIIEEIGTKNFPRMRLGIGSVPDSINSKDFVLGQFFDDELKKKQKMIVSAAKAVILAVRSGLDEAMTKFNINPA